MKIHSDIITARTIFESLPEGCYLAAFYDKNDVWTTCAEENSRQRERGYIVRLSGSHKSVMQSLPDKAATWDEWGFFLRELFKIDPKAICGTYKGVEDFDTKTNGDFA